jgi:hypothetical protein
MDDATLDWISQNRDFLDPFGDRESNSQENLITELLPSEDFDETTFGHIEFQESVGNIFMDNDPYVYTEEGGYSYGDGYGDADADAEKETETESAVPPIIQKASKKPAKWSRIRFPADATKELESWILAHRIVPYPSEEEKTQWCKKYNLTKKKLDVFFTNHRTRLRKNYKILTARDWWFNRIQ